MSSRHRQLGTVELAFERGQGTLIAFAVPENTLGFRCSYRVQLERRAMIAHCRARLRVDAKKKRKLHKLGGRMTTVAEFLDLDEAEAAIIELRLELAAAVKKRRTTARMTQAALAKAIGSTQARVAKMESGDPQASIESFIRALAVLGAKPRLKVA